MLLKKMSKNKNTYHRNQLNGFTETSQLSFDELICYLLIMCFLDNLITLWFS